MIANVIDNRKLRYRWKRINAIAEPAWHDTNVRMLTKLSRSQVSSIMTSGMEYL